ncbi:molybdenum cofactor guanylyltransferase MobA [Aurantimonas sp. VKM B-3413]|uniref:molybdenum cofactor guanylyltransferase MobA n=1 Tax=Aurantimonas sp. VKM B-3413 TaxID=2779401 RepID=UPI001E58959C|nr:molybdenum cofactor guanylyltransferase MobA [Aurantimonas sp. VKM B-3413]MCB8839223.1 molybdenum cofactor guanylyltransferase [Aurantimonas sp. VKM B-3413]
MTPAGLILAGGRGSRMGGGVPKPLLRLCGRAMLAHVVDRLSGSCAPLWINAQAGAGYEAFGLELVADRRADFRGPLAGVEAGLTRLAETPALATHLLTVPGDTPFLPRDIVERMTEDAGSRPVVARFAGRLQPTVSLWPLAILPDLTAWLDAGKPLAMRAFLDAVGHGAVDIPPNDHAPEGNPFFNVNTPDDLALAEAFSGKA